MPSKIITRVFIYVFLICLGFVFLPLKSSYSVSANKVQMIQLNDDTINPVTADYITKAIDRAYGDAAQCLIIKMDTPGGLLNSTRLIVKKMLTSKVPIVVYITPSGSRAGSAGVFITYASHIAAMAPSTNIGAAHPVQMGGSAPRRSGEWDELKELIKDLKEAKKIVKESKEEKGQPTEAGQQKKEEIKPDENPMESKILHDTLAFIKAIAKERGRNEEWAVESVAQSASITSEEALEKGVIEIIAKNDEDLLQQLDGRSVRINGEEKILHTKDAQIEFIDMDAREKFFNVLANPNIAYFLMILGFYGLLFEVTHPGFGIPGVLGIVFLILAFYSMQTLPTNYAGLALLVLGIVFFVAEAFTPTFGVLALGGITCLILGSMLLFDSVDPIMRVSLNVIIPVVTVTAVFFIFVIGSVVRALRRKPVSGKEGLIDSIGAVEKDIIPPGLGKVFIHGELWNAECAQQALKGTKVKVIKINGLTLTVEPENNKGG